MSNKKNNQKGFTFTELLMALVLIAIGIISSVGLILFSYSRTMELSPKLTASYLTQEGVEVIRRIREDNWIGIKICLDDALGKINNPPAGVTMEQLIENALACESEDAWIKGLVNLSGGAMSGNATGRVNYNSERLEVWNNVGPNFFNIYYFPCGPNVLMNNCGFRHLNQGETTNKTALFRRKINITNNQQEDKLIITITINWLERGSWNNELVTTTELYNWYPIEYDN